MDFLQQLNVFQINLMHVLVIGPLLIYIGQKGKKNNEAIYYSILTMILLMPFMVELPSLQFKRKKDYINSIHLIIFTWIGYYIYKKKNQLSEISFELMKYFGIATVSIHLYLAYEKYQKYF